MKYFKYPFVDYNNMFKTEICIWYYISEQEIIDNHLSKFTNDLKGWSKGWSKITPINYAKQEEIAELCVIHWIRNNKAIEVSETEYILKYKSPETVNE